MEILLILSILTSIVLAWRVKTLRMDNRYLSEDKKKYQESSHLFEKQLKNMEYMSGAERLKFAYEKIDIEVFVHIPKSAENWRGHKHIAQILGLSEAIVKKSVSRLRQKGWIKLETIRNGNFANGTGYIKLKDTLKTR